MSTWKKVCAHTLLLGLQRTENCGEPRPEVTWHIKEHFRTNIVFKLLFYFIFFKIVPLWETLQKASSILDYLDWAV